MTSDEIKYMILDIIQELDETFEVKELDEDKLLRDQLDWDSMDYLDIVVELRKRTHLQIPEEEYIPLLISLSSVKFREVPNIVARLLEAGR